MLPVIAGLLAGAGALYAAVELSASKEEDGRGGDFEVRDLDVKGVKGRLDAYFWAASKLYQRCNDLAMKSCDMMMGSIELPDDDAVTKLGNKAYDLMLPVSRSMILSQLKDVNNDCHKLLKRYAGVFKKANAVLEANGKEAIFIRKRHVGSASLVLNNALENDNWSDDFEALLDKVRDFIEASYDAANEMIDALDSLDVTDVAGCGSSSHGDDGLKSICA